MILRGEVISVLWERTVCPFKYITLNRDFGDCDDVHPVIQALASSTAETCFMLGARIRSVREYEVH